MSDSAQSVKVLNELFEKLSVATPDNRSAAAVEVASFLNGNIIEHDVPEEFFANLKKALKDKKAAANALEAINHIASETGLSPSVEPYMVSLVPEICAKAGDKDKDTQALAAAALLALSKAINPVAIKAFLPLLTNALESTSKWQEKVAILAAISSLVDAAKDQRGNGSQNGNLFLPLGSRFQSVGQQSQASCYCHHDQGHRNRRQQGY